MSWYRVALTVLMTVAVLAIGVAIVLVGMTAR